MKPEHEKKIHGLEKKISTLTKENQQLSERADDAILLGFVSESISHTKDYKSLFNLVLERISNLKAIPYCSYCKIEKEQIKTMGYYSSYPHDLKLRDIVYSKTIAAEIENKIAMFNSEECKTLGFLDMFPKKSFIPRAIALFYFSSRDIPDGLFLFMDDTLKKDGLSPKLVILTRVVEITITKLDEFKIIQDLTLLNRELDKRVAQRTAQLEDTAQKLKKEIQERKRTEQERLRSLNLESLGAFAGGIAHDFNNLLTIIHGNIDLAKEDATSPDVISCLLESEKACYEATELAGQMITFSGGGILCKKTQNIAQLIEDITNFTLSGYDLTYDLSLSPNLWPVIADQEQIKTIFKNLCANAVQAMPNGGIVRIKARNFEYAFHDKSVPPGIPKGNYVKICLTDQGVGISEKNLPLIFDPYFSTGTRGVKRGMGLGLTMVYSIIKNCDGYINIKSQLNVGTIVEVYLPAET
ncbi:MAG: hypothetical protein GY710_10160 [Desulfobacteraceae bacterium]|nr:hypothetical protein [Desulfobacteraceae bacterium]